LQKGFRGLEIDRTGWTVGATLSDDRLTDGTREGILAAIGTPTPERLFQIKRLLVMGVPVDAIAERSRMDPWFLSQLEELVQAERDWVAAKRPSAAPTDSLGPLKDPAAEAAEKALIRAMKRM